MEGRFLVPGSVIPLPPWELAEDRAYVMPDTTGPRHDPPLEPRDETVFLLTAAAEIEHALMVQYLFAAYSVRVVPGDPNADALGVIQQLLAQIAREEMGHLATVENLLHLVGGPLNFNREHSPYASEIYPFRFKLQALTLDSLAKYVIAESPLVLPEDFPPDDKELLKQIRLDATRSNDGQEVRHVGPIYARLAELFANELADGDFRLNTFGRQAKYEDWGFQPRAPQPGELGEGEALIIDSFPGDDVAKIREAAVNAVHEIGAQGEGFDLDPTGFESHFERFFVIYKRVRDLFSAGAVITWPVAENPNTTSSPKHKPGMADMVEMVQEAYASKGRITHPRTRAWAQLFNLRYRILLARLSHVLRLDQALFITGPGAHQGDRTARGLLLIWTFDEMRRLRKIATKLVQLPKDDPPGELHAGPPFELPYTLNLPEDEPQRWRTHLDISRAAVRLIREKLQPDDQTTDRDEFLDDLLRLDGEAQVVMQALAEGRDIPPDSLPSDFQKVVRILEEAIRGFTIGGPHRNFWAGKDRDAFLNTSPIPGEPVILHNPDGTINTDPDTSPLVQRLEGPPPPRNRMPRFRPAVPPERIGFIRQWITEGAPDNDPPGQIGLMHERDPRPEPLTMPPPPPPTLGFEADIKGLFRENPDRVSMLVFGRFDLHRYEDVRDHADDILARLMDGSMPCDGSWPPDRIAIFRRWIDEGKRP